MSYVFVSIGIVCSTRVAGARLGPRFSPVDYGLSAHSRARDLRGANPPRRPSTQPPQVLPAAKPLLRIRLAGLGVQQLRPRRVRALRRYTARGEPPLRCLRQLHCPRLDDLRLDREQPPAPGQRHLQKPALQQLVRPRGDLVCPQGPVSHRADSRRRHSHHPDPTDLLQADLQRHPVGLPLRQVRIHVPRLAHQLAGQPGRNPVRGRSPRGKLHPPARRPGAWPKWATSPRWGRRGSAPTTRGAPSTWATIRSRAS